MSVSKNSRTKKSFRQIFVTRFKSMLLETTTIKRHKHQNKFTMFKIVAEILAAHMCVDPLRHVEAPQHRRGDRPTSKAPRSARSHNNTQAHAPTQDHDPPHTTKLEQTRKQKHACTEAHTYRTHVKAKRQIFSLHGFCDAWSQQIYEARHLDHILTAYAHLYLVPFRLHKSSRVYAYSLVSLTSHFCDAAQQHFSQLGFHYLQLAVQISNPLNASPSNQKDSLAQSRSK